MNLLIFAHRGEAQEFIKNLALKSAGKDLYLNEDFVLLITGEGIYEAFTKLGPVLGEYPIKKAFNLGIAGALEDTISLDDFHEIKTVYCHTGRPLFQSFTLDHQKDALDLITSDERVLSNTHAMKLSNFAPLVDRELWAIAKLCNEKSIPLRSFKLISDMAGGATDCFDLKQKAMEFSTKLLEFWLTLEQPKHSEDSELLPPMPMSFTQKARYKALTKSIKLSDLDFKALEENILNDLGPSLTAKQKANALLDSLELVTNPVKLATKTKFDKLSTPASEIGAKLIFDKSFEKKKFTLQMEINDQKNIENLSKLADKLKFSDFEKVWNGDVDV